MEIYDLLEELGVITWEDTPSGGYHANYDLNTGETWLIHTWLKRTGERITFTLELIENLVKGQRIRWNYFKITGTKYETGFGVLSADLGDIEKAREQYYQGLISTMEKRIKKLEDEQRVLDLQVYEWSKYTKDAYPDLPNSKWEYRVGQLPSQIILPRRVEVRYLDSHQFFFKDPILCKWYYHYHREKTWLRKTILKNTWNEVYSEFDLGFSTFREDFRILKDTRVKKYTRLLERYRNILCL